jgi:hypothetical protein
MIYVVKGEQASYQKALDLTYRKNRGESFGMYIVVDTERKTITNVQDGKYLSEDEKESQIPFDEFMKLQITPETITLADNKLPKLMEVENSISAWVKRYVMMINPNGSCLVIKGHPDNMDLINITPEHLALFKSCREIKEPTWRAYTKEEIEPLLDCWFRAKDQNKKEWGRCLRYDFEEETSTNIQLSDGQWYSLEKLLKYFEVKIDGKWQPAGVLEQ